MDDSLEKNPGVLRMGNWQIRQGECWGVIGANGSGKTTLARKLSGEIPADPDTLNTSLQNILCVSFEDEQKLLEREIYEDDSESMDRIDYGRTTRELITELARPDTDIGGLIDNMQLQQCIDTGFRLLSTGERRRMMIARALSQQPDMLVLDEPFDGLDIHFSAHLAEVLESLAGEVPLVIIVNRLSQLGDAVTHIACLDQGSLILTDNRENVQRSPLWQQYQEMQIEMPPLPRPPPDFSPYHPEPDTPVIRMSRVSVGYQNKPVIADLDWTVMPGEHWKVSGPNGCGKSTLVNLVSGDHPQCYANEIHLFGKRRGQGESIWDIKRHMGLMSTALHQQYRVTVTAETVVLSGFFDSIGVYRRPQPWQRELAGEWLAFLHMTDHLSTPFQQLSFGQQRMLLIARALVKRPHLLILDEPCQGLDPMNRALVIQLISRICESGLAQLLYISHDPEDHLPCLTHELMFVPRKNTTSPTQPPYEVRQVKLV